MHEKLFRQPTPLIASVCAVGARIGVLRTEFTGPGRALVSQPAVIVEIHDLREGITIYNVW
jgi:hypothetical protein